jgi:glycolate oxidase
MLELVDGVSEISRRHAVAIACFGHAGDGNIHVNVLYDRADEAERPRADRAVEDIFTHVLALGGSISGEHGIGTTKARFLSWEVGEREIALMRGIKRLLDPNNILNPGKIFLE